MNLNFALPDDAMIYRLGWTLVHTLWLGAAVAAAFVVAMAALRNRSARSRYLAGCAAMVLFMAGAVAAFALTPPPARPAVVAGAPVVAPAVLPPPAPVPTPAENQAVAEPSAGAIEPLPAAPTTPPRVRVERPATPPAAARPEPSLLARAAAAIEPALPWLVLGWSVGVCIVALWQAAGWVAAGRLKRLAVRPADAGLVELAERLVRKVGVTRAVRVLESALVRVPTVIGWLRPVILLPLGFAAGLSAAQVESILVHELSHIRRYDYLVNLLQSLVETLLFYHPAVWYVSRRVRLERENCCDDLALALGANQHSYAESLLHLARQSQASGRFAVSPLGVTAAGRPSELRSRVGRMLGAKEETSRLARSWPAAILVLVAIVASTVLVNCGMQNRGPVLSMNSGQASPRPATVEVSRYGDVRTAHGEATRLMTVRVDSTEHKITDETQRLQIAPGEHTLHLYYGAKEPPKGMELSLFYPQAELRFRAEAGQTYRIVGKTRGIGSSSMTTHEVLDPAGKVVARAPVPLTLPASRPATDAAEIDRLIRQLSGDKVAERDAAQESLVKMGAPAVAALQKAAGDKDVERANRAKAALTQIEEAGWLLELVGTWRLVSEHNIVMTLAADGKQEVRSADGTITSGRWARFGKELLVATGEGKPLAKNDTQCRRERIHLVTPNRLQLESLDHAVHPCLLWIRDGAPNWMALGEGLDPAQPGGKAAIDKAFAALIDQLANADPGTPWPESTFLFLGESSLPYLSAAVKDGRRTVRARAVTLLGKINRVQALPALMQAAHDEANEVAAAALPLLAQESKGRPELVAEIDKVLKEAAAAQRMPVVDTATLELEQIGDVSFRQDEDLLKELLSLLEKKQGDELVIVATVLGRTRNPKAMAPLAAALAKGKEVHALASAVAAVGGRAACKPLLEALQRDSGSDSNIGLALASLADPGLNDELLKLAKSGVWGGNGAIIALGFGGNTAVVKSIATLVAEKPVLWLPSIQALGKIGGDDAAAVLGDMLMKPAPEGMDGFYRLQLGSSLAATGSAQALPALLEGLKHKNRNVVCAAAEGLGYLRDPKAIPDLMDLFDRPDALGQMDNYYVSIASAANTALCRITNTPPSIGIGREGSPPHARRGWEAYIKHAAAVSALASASASAPASGSPRFLGLPDDAQLRYGNEAPIAAEVAKITVVLQATRADYDAARKVGQIKQELRIGDWLYWSSDDFIGLAQPGSLPDWFPQTRRFKTLVPVPATAPASSTSSGPSSRPAGEEKTTLVTRIDEAGLLKELGIKPDRTDVGSFGWSLLQMGAGRGEVVGLDVAVCASREAARALYKESHQYLSVAPAPDAWGLQVGDDRTVGRNGEWIFFVRDNVFVQVSCKEVLDTKLVQRLDKMLTASAAPVTRGQFVEPPALKDLPARLALPLDETVELPFVPAGLGTAPPRVGVRVFGAMEGVALDGRIRLDAPGLMDNPTTLPVDVFAVGDGLVFARTRIEVELKPAAGLTRDQRWQLLRAAMAANPLDRARARTALTDVGNVALEFRKSQKEPPAAGTLPPGVRVLKSDAGVVLQYDDGLNRVERGEPPEAWIDLLAKAKQAGFELNRDRSDYRTIALAPTAAVRQQRDRLLAEADEKIRSGLLALAEQFPTLRKPAGSKSLAELLRPSPAGQIEADVTSFASDADRFAITVKLEPLHFPGAGNWPWMNWQPNRFNHLALMGRISCGAGEPKLDAAIKNLVADALAALQTLDQQAASAVPSTPATGSTSSGPVVPPVTDSAMIVGRAYERIYGRISALAGAYPILKNMSADARAISNAEPGRARVETGFTFARNTKVVPKAGPVADDTSKPFCSISLIVRTPPEESLQPTPDAPPIHQIAGFAWQEVLEARADNPELVKAVKAIVAEELARAASPSERISPAEQARQYALAAAAFDRVVARTRAMEKDFPVLKGLADAKFEHVKSGGQWGVELHSRLVFEANMSRSPLATIGPEDQTKPYCRLDLGFFVYPAPEPGDGRPFAARWFRVSGGVFTSEQALEDRFNQILREELGGNELRGPTPAATATASAPATRPAQSDMARKIVEGMPAGWKLTGSGRSAAPNRWSSDPAMGKESCEYLSLRHGILQADSPPGPANFSLWLMPAEYRGFRFESNLGQPGGAALIGAGEKWLLFTEGGWPQRAEDRAPIEAMFRALGLDQPKDRELSPAAAAVATRPAGPTAGDKTGSVPHGSGLWAAMGPHLSGRFAFAAAAKATKEPLVVPLRDGTAVVSQWFQFTESLAGEADTRFPYPLSYTFRTGGGWEERPIFKDEQVILAVRIDNAQRFALCFFADTPELRKEVQAATEEVRELSALSLQEMVDQKVRNGRWPGGQWHEARAWFREKIAAAMPEARARVARQIADEVRQLQKGEQVGPDTWRTLHDHSDLATCLGDLGARMELIDILAREHGFVCHGPPEIVDALVACGQREDAWLLVRKFPDLGGDGGKECLHEALQRLTGLTPVKPAAGGAEAYARAWSESLAAAGIAKPAAAAPATTSAPAMHPAATRPTTAPAGERYFATIGVGDELCNAKQEVATTSELSEKMFTATRGHLAAGWKDLLPADIKPAADAVGLPDIGKIHGQPPASQEPFAHVAKFSDKHLVIQISRPGGSYLWHHYEDNLAVLRVDRTAGLDKAFDLPALELAHGGKFRGICQGDASARVEQILGKPDKVETTQAMEFILWHYQQGKVVVQLWQGRVQRVVLAADAETAPPATGPAATRPAARLGTQSDEQVIRLISDLRGAKDSAGQLAAIRELGRSGDAARPARPALPALVALKKLDDDWPEGESDKLVEKLLPVKAEDLPWIAEGLNDPAEWVQQRCLMWLADIGPAAKPAVPAIVEKLKTQSSYELHAFAAGALRKIGPDAVEAGLVYLRQAIKDKDKRVRYLAIDSINSMGIAAKAALPELQVALGDEEVSNRIAAVRALDSWGKEAIAAASAVLPLLKDQSLDARRHAAHALAHMGKLPDKVAEALPAFVEGKDELTDVCLAVTLVNSGKAALWLDRVLTAARRPHNTLRDTESREAHYDSLMFAVESLGQIGDAKKEVVDVLVANLIGGDAEFEDRRRTAKAAGDDDGFPRGDDGLPHIRMAAAKSLGQCGLAAKSALEALRKSAAHDTDPVVCAESTKAIELVTGKAAATQSATAPATRPASTRPASGPATGPSATRESAETLSEQEKERFSRLVQAMKDHYSDTSRLHEAQVELAKMGPRITPSLVSLLREDSGYAGLHTWAVEVLGAIGDRRAVEPLIAFMDSSAFYEGRVKAAEVLGALGDPRAVPPLIRQLQPSHSQYVQTAAARALGQLGDRSAIRPLIEQLRTHDYHLARMAAAGALGTLRAEEAIEPLIKEVQVRKGDRWSFGSHDQQDWWLDEQDNYSSAAARKALVQIGPPTITPIIAAVEATEIRDYYRFVDVLSQVKGEKVVAQLLAALESRKADARAAAAAALRLRKEPLAVEPLAKLLNDEDATVREQAALALGYFKDRRARKPLEAMVVSKDDSTRIRAAWALEELGDPEAAPALVEGLTLPGTPPAFGAGNEIAGAIGKLGNQAVVPALIKHLENAQAPNRAAATQALGLLKARAAAPSLIAALKDEPSVRASSAAALGLIGDPRAVEPLIGLLNLTGDEDAFRDSRTRAIQSLAMIGDGRAVRPLQNLLAQHRAATDRHGFFSMSPTANDLSDAEYAKEILAALKQLNAPEKATPESAPAKP